MSALPTVTAATSSPKGALTAVGIRSDLLDADLPAGVDRAVVDAVGFDAKAAGTATVAGESGPTVLVGLGPSDEITARTLRTVGGALARAVRRHPQVGVEVLTRVGDGVEAADAASALAEGLALGGYRYTAYKQPPSEHAADQRITVVVEGAAGKRAVQRGAEVAGAVALARDLVNEPGGSLTPMAFADRAVEVAQASGLGIEVLDADGIVAAGLGGLAGVNRGSSQPARFVTLTHAPARPTASVALVGKGITFDSGGLSIKTADGMTTMKSDMSGAAAVLATMSVVAAHAPKVAVTAYLPLTDNMTGGDATRVGDVLRLRNAKTVEVLNTDAEGRLVLGDALALASEAAPDAIVDLATLTGAAMVALGPRTAGLMGNDDGWCGQVRAAADAVGEDVWPLPLPPYLRRGLDSEIADLRNVGTGRNGGALTAGLFLREFVGDGIPWAHLDIAGPAFADYEEGEVTKGGTGYGVRLLLRLLTDFVRP